MKKLILFLTIPIILVTLVYIVNTPTKPSEPQESNKLKIAKMTSSMTQLFNSPQTENLDNFPKLERKENIPTDEEKVITEPEISEVVDVNSMLYRNLKEAYQEKKFLGRSISDTEFVIAREHPKGLVVFSKYHSSFKYFRENPETYFELMQDSVFDERENVENVTEFKHNFLNLLYDISPDFNVNVVSTYCAETKCYFEIHYVSSEDASRLIAQIESNSMFFTVVDGIYWEERVSFIGTASFMQFP